MDIQGAEVDVLEYAAEAVDKQVKRVYIVTHDRNNSCEQRIRKLFSRMGWFTVFDFPYYSKWQMPDKNHVDFIDSVQFYVNPKLVDKIPEYAYVNPISKYDN